MHHIAIPQLRQPVTGFSLCSLGFDPRAVHMEFVMCNGGIWTSVSPGASFLCLIYQSTTASHPFIYHLRQVWRVLKWPHYQETQHCPTTKDGVGETREGPKFQRTRLPLFTGWDARDRFLQKICIGLQTTHGHNPKDVILYLILEQLQTYCNGLLNSQQNGSGGWVETMTYEL